MTATRAVPSVARRLSLVAAVLVLGACSTAGRSGSEVTALPAVPDQQLYDQIAAIDHVTSVSVSFSDAVGRGPDYDGDVLVDASANLLCVADQVYAILWQGRSADNAVIVRQGSAIAGAPELGLPTNPHSDAEAQTWVDRYGLRTTAAAAALPSRGGAPAPPADGPCAETTPRPTS